MAVSVIKGNIFTSNCQTIVNTVNCVGVMGAGIALECRFRYPEMYRRYVELCKAGQIEIGKLWIYRSGRWILNFPTKYDWKKPSKTDYLEAGLEKFVNTYKRKGVNSIAFPLLGADKGGISEDLSLDLMRRYLDDVDIYVEIYRYDPTAKDDLFESTKEWLLSKNGSEISRLTGLRSQYVNKVLESVQRPDIVQLNQLARVKGIGIKTMESLFWASRTSDSSDDGGSGGEQEVLPL